MSINWQWTDKMGTCTYTDGRTCNLYQGNALMIAVTEFPPTDPNNPNDTGTYCLSWFAADKEHLRNMLGLNKGYDNCFADFNIAKLRLNTGYKSVPQIVSDIAKAQLPITIELYYEPNDYTHARKKTRL